jgi:hypothetical protein
MNLTNQHLQPILVSITSTLAPMPDQLEIFTDWADQQALRLRRAVEKGREFLVAEAALLRDDLNLFTPPCEFDGQHLTARTERLRLCQQLWLTGLIDFVDDLLLEQKQVQTTSWNPPTTIWSSDPTENMVSLKSENLSLASSPTDSSASSRVVAESLSGDNG